MHGHDGLIRVEFSKDLNYDKSTDLAMTGVSTFIQHYLNGKFLLDLSDPWFNNITGLEPVWKPSKEVGEKPMLSGFVPRRVLNTTNETELEATHIYRYSFIAYGVYTKQMSGVEKDFFDSFTFTPFPPDPPNLAKWIYKFIEPLNVQVSRVDWYQSGQKEGSYF
jgi:hypothetical protein